MTEHEQNPPESDMETAPSDQREPETSGFGREVAENRASGHRVLPGNTVQPDNTVPPVPPVSYAAPARAERGSAHYKSPLLAGFLSFMPGLGNIYNGLYLRGVAFFLSFVGLMSLIVTIADGGGSGHESESQIAFLAPSLAFLWFFSVFDSYRQATLINSGEATDLGISDQPRPGKGSAMVPGVMLMVIGLYGVLRRIFDFDLSWLVQQWPYLLLAFGGFLVYQAMQARREAAAGDSEAY